MQKTNVSVVYMSHSLPKRWGCINATGEGQDLPWALLSAVVEKDEVLPAQVWSRGTRSIGGVGTPLYQLQPPSPSEWQPRGDTVTFFKYSSG